MTQSVVVWYHVYISGQSQPVDVLLVGFLGLMGRKSCSLMVVVSHHDLILLLQTRCRFVCSDSSVAPRLFTHPPDTERHQHSLGVVFVSKCLVFKLQKPRLCSPAGCQLCLSAVQRRAGSLLWVCQDFFGCLVRLENRIMRAVRLNRAAKSWAVNE